MSKEDQDNDIVTPNAWHDYFKSLLGENDIDNAKDKEMLAKIKLLENKHIEISDILNKEMSNREIFGVIQGLKNRKAVSLESISNEMIK